jgi:DNA-directed DNA polymerase III PolC
MYVPLRCHGHHALLTGVGSPAEWLRRAAELGLPALALPEVDSLAGLVEFLEAAAEEALQPGAPPGSGSGSGSGAGSDSGSNAPAPPVRPLVACELTDGGGRPGRVVALVESEAGYRNLCRLITRRRLGHAPGDAPPPSSDDPALDESGAHFDLVQELVAHQEGLLLLADHPRLLLGLNGRVEPRRLLALLSSAAPGLDGLRDPRAARSAPRNTHRSELRGTDPSTSKLPSLPSEPQASLTGAKTPPPAPPVAARTLLEAALATGVALVASPDAWYLHPDQAEDHAVRVAIKHGALLEGLPQAWLAACPAHLPSTAELAARLERVPDLPGAWPLDDSARLRVREAFPHLGRSWEELPPALARSLVVAAHCRYTPPLGGVHFPEVHLEDGETPYSRLCSLALDGARRRFRPLRPEVLHRLDHELGTIQRLGFAPYFLLVEGLAAHAREEGIPCVGRGSAADSLVAYCLGLTDADPFRYRLPFERFLNPARRDRPDIDLDFCWRRRDEVLDHVFELFGAERTAMISTLNRFGLRSAFREAALAHGIPPAEINPWSARLPMFLGESLNAREADADGAHALEGDAPEEGIPRAGSLEEDTLEESAVAQDTLPTAIERRPFERRGSPSSEHATRPTAESLQVAETPRTRGPGRLGLAVAALPETRGFPLDDPRFRRALASAEALLDAPRHFGLHPGGVVVAPGPIDTFVPCQPSAKGPVVTQLDKDGVEAIGLVKMDLLGNRALTTVADCLGLLRERGVEVDLEGLPEDDPATARALREGRTLGCFQIESPGMRHLLQQTGAWRMDDVIQAVALIRPGPAGCGMKDAYVRRFRGLEEPVPPHPRVEDLLADTHGVMLYQEDVMQVAARVAGLELAEADQLRRALQKRRYDELAPLKERFMEGAESQGLEESEATALWDRLAGFASFAFCKAHAVTYGRLAYRAAWLKTHHPAAFLTAFLLSETGYYPSRVYVEEARRLGVRILGPDINRSGAGFELERGAGPPSLRVGLGRARGLSEATLERLLESRDREGPYLSLPDFLERTGARRDEAETLVRVGAFDAFDRTRPELLWRLHLLLEPQARAPRDARLDGRALAACRDGRSARSGLEGWSGRGLGVDAASLRPGETASLFAPPPPEAVVLPGLPGPDARERGQEEFRLLGLTLASHPVDLFPCPGEQRAREQLGRGPGQARGDFHSRSEGAPQEQGVRPVNPCPCAGLSERVGARVTLRGWPAATRRARTERGELMRFLTLEDPSGLAEVILFPDVYRRDGHLLDLDAVVLVTGVVEEQLGACALRVERLW